METIRQILFALFWNLVVPLLLLLLGFALYILLHGLLGTSMQLASFIALTVPFVLCVVLAKHES